MRKKVTDVNFQRQVLLRCPLWQVFLRHEIELSQFQALLKPRRLALHEVLLEPNVPGDVFIVLWGTFDERVSDLDFPIQHPGTLILGHRILASSVRCTSASGSAVLFCTGAKFKTLWGQRTPALQRAFQNWVEGSGQQRAVTGLAPGRVVPHVPPTSQERRSSTGMPVADYHDYATTDDTSTDASTLLRIHDHGSTAVLRRATPSQDTCAHVRAKTHQRTACRVTVSKFNTSLEERPVNRVKVNKAPLTVQAHQQQHYGRLLAREDHRDEQGKQRHLVLRKARGSAFRPLALDQLKS